MPPLLSVEALQTCFSFPQGIQCAVNDVSLSIDRGSTLALVGESGSGKSLTALSILRLVPKPGFIRQGRILFDGTDLLGIPEQKMSEIRGNRISMIFQEPMTSLNPVLKIGLQIMEPLLLHRGIRRAEAGDRAVELLRTVGIPDPGRRMGDYPHQLSGGMRQRVMIAMALACGPDLLIADEPTTALDVTIQAQILELLDALRKSSDMSVLLVTHDLGIVAERSDFTCVMYAGRIVESGPSRSLLAQPAHPYTRGLLESLPQNARPGEPLRALEGQPPLLGSATSGCGFCERCPRVLPPCHHQVPEMTEVAPGHHVRCWNRI